MELLIAGATGFIGCELVKALKTSHQITVVGRDRPNLQRTFPQGISICTWDDLDQLDAKTFNVIINLAGHNIAATRWNESVKRKIIDSRVNTSNALIQWAIKHQAKPRFFSANAVGIYGLQENGDTLAFDEDSPINVDQPSDYLSEIGVRWQQVLESAIDYGMPVTTTRFGVVLEKHHGMLKKLGLSFKLGLGSTIGDGKQVISWVHISDVIASIQFLLDHPALTGPFNITSPYPVSQKEFANTLAHILHRPLILTMPAFAIRMLFGEMGDCLLLHGQRVLPKRLLEAGYKFNYPNLRDALLHEF